MNSYNCYFKTEKGRKEGRKETQFKTFLPSLGGFQKPQSSGKDRKKGRTGTRFLPLDSRIETTPPFCLLATTAHKGLLLKPWSFVTSSPLQEVVITGGFPRSSAFAVCVAAEQVISLELAFSFSLPSFTFPPGGEDLEGLEVHARGRRDARTRGL